MTDSLGPIEVHRHEGTEPLHRGGRPIGVEVSSFWQWACSDLLGNALRGVFGEYVVALALDVADGVRMQWDAVDLVTKDGIKVEVKSSAYLQSWYQDRLSAISFSIRPTRAWDATSNTFESCARRQADVYVFCLLDHRDKATVDPRDLDQWRFFALSASVLDAKMNDRKRISLAQLLEFEPTEVAFDGIADAVRAASA